MRGATVKLLRSIPWWTIPSPPGGYTVDTQRQKRRYLLREYPNAKDRGRLRNAARYEGWFKDGKKKRIERAVARVAGKAGRQSYIKALKERRYNRGICL